MNDAELKRITEEDTRESNRRFLKSWKIAVKAVGPELFDATLTVVDAATDCNDLRPNMAAIERHVNAHEHDLHYFLFMVMSFFSFVALCVPVLSFPA